MNQDNIVLDGVNGVLCKKKTSETLAESIQKIISDKDLYSKMSEGSLNSFKKYSVEEVIKILECEL